MKLSQKTILVTGGNSGIGLSLVKQLHGFGNKIVVVSRSQNNWSLLADYSPDVITLQCDLGKCNEVQQLVTTLYEQQIQLDLLINCAAIQLTPQLIDEEFDLNGVEREMTINFTSIVWLSYLLLPMLLLRPQSGIVNLSSGLAICPKTASAVYCASKAALHSFSQSLRYQLASHSVQVTEVLLPLVDTPMTAGRGSGKITSLQAAEAIISGVEQGRSEVYVGKARLLPLMMRLWPNLMKKIVSRY